MKPLSPEEWKELSPYLDRALSLSGEQRVAWLASLRGENAGLAGQVEELLRERTAADREGFLLNSPAAPRTSELAGQVLGAYRLLSPIGQGGMGVVWLAERADGRFKRYAAVKFLSHALVGDSGLARFKREGTILGSLSHPNIAELWDAGVSTAGHPYLVLEFVEGSRITSYCDDNRLDVRARICLFLDVLGAVAHAHANLIVHRDLKPSNVFVSTEGTVKLLDFGIAKLLESGEGEAPTLLTRDAGSPLTPEYAAPEQVTGAAITTATDVYALGVLLYEILTGQHPAGANRRSAADLVRAIVETDPQRPSTAVTSASFEDAKATALQRNADPEKLRRQLQGDLDTIITKALKKDPKERYVSVVALADDLRRYLEYQPISARPDTVAYRARKFIRRNLATVSLTATALALIIASLATGLYIANRERRTAEQRFMQVRQLANKFIELDHKVRGLPGSTNLRKEMVLDAQQYLTALSSGTRLDHDLSLEIAVAYVRVAHVQGDPTSPNLGQFPEAEANLNQAEKFVNAILAENPKDRQGLISAAMIAHDRMTMANAQHHNDQVLPQADKAAAFLQRFMELGNVQEKEAQAAAYFYSNVATDYANFKRIDDAKRVALLDLDLAQRFEKTRYLLGPLHVLLANTLWLSGDPLSALKSVDEGIPLSEAAAAAAGGFVPLRINLADSLLLKGMILGQQDAQPSLGRTQEAVAVIERSLGILEEIAKQDSSDHLSRHRLAAVSLELGNILRHQEPRRALAVYGRALTFIRESNQSTSAQVDEAELLAASSYAVRRLGNVGAAKERLDQALRLLTATQHYPADKVEPMSAVDHTLRALGDHYSETNQTAKAVEIYRELFGKLMASGPDLQNTLGDAICISRTWTALARLQRRLGQPAEADRLEAQRSDLWNQWKAKLPNAQVLFQQSLVLATDQTKAPARRASAFSSPL